MTSHKGWAFALTSLQLALILVIVYRFEIAAPNHFFPVLCVAVGGFLVHAWLPARFRATFFGLLSLGGILFFLGWPNGAFLIAIGGGLIAVCYLPVPLALRVAIIGLAALGLSMLRLDYDRPFWAVLGSMFMFRLIVYLFELRGAHERPPLDLTVAYFFPLPNVSFLFFPILDFKTFCATYRPDVPWSVTQTGIGWIARGLMHLLLYRVVKYYVLPAPHELGDLPHLALFLAANYALYLRVSGYFHIITGLLHLFGFALPRTHDNYFLASSFTDVWRRINIYWKDFMAKVFFFPAFFALRGWRTTTAMVVATLWVFLASWMLHAYQVFWVTGGLPLRLYDAALWLVAGVLVAVNVLFDFARAGRPGRRGTSWLSALGLSLRVVGMFVLVSLFWAGWNTPYIFGFLRAQMQAGPAALSGGAVVLGILLAIVAAGTLAQLAWDRLARRELLPLRFSPAGAAWGLTAGLAAFALAGTVPLAGAFGPRTAAVVASLRRESATPVEAAQVVQGYYEEMTRAHAMTGSWMAALEGQPRPPDRVYYTEMTRPTDDLLERELIPNWSGEVEGSRLTINRFGMRDRPDLAQKKPPGVCRVAVVGSSVVMGYGVGDDETFPRLLEDRLNAGRPAGSSRYEVLNFGTGRSFAIQKHVLIDRKVFAFEPDAVYYVAHQDEFQGTVQHLAKLVAKRDELPYACLNDVVRKAGITPDTSWGMTAVLLQPLAPEIVRGLYRDLVGECRRRGVRPVWVYLPMPGVTNAPVQSAPFVKLAEQAGFAVVDLSDWDAGYRAVEVKLGEADPHPNVLGQRLIAERLDAELRRRPELLPAAGRVQP